MSEAAKRKIAFLVPNMRTGGAERVVSLLLQNLDRSRFVVELVTAFDPCAEYVIPDDVATFVLAEEPEPEPAPCPVDLPEGSGAEDRDALAWLNATAARLVSYAERQQPDVIVSTPLWSSVLVALAHDRLPSSTKWIHREAAMPSMSVARDPNGDVLAAVMRARFNLADRVIAVSSAAGDDLVATFGVAPALIEVVSNPIDTARIAALAEETVDEPWFSEDVPVVTFVGRLERVKGLEYLIRAVASPNVPTAVRLILVGDGSQRGYLTALAKHLGILDRIRFAGQQANPFRYVGRSDLFVLPSLSEGMPNVLIESMACGCPVVATDIAGGITREVLADGEYGSIVPREDERALAEAISALLGDDDLRSRRAADGRTRSMQWDLPVVVRRYESLLDEVTDLPDRPETAPRPTPASPESDAVEAPALPPLSRRIAARLGRILGGAGKADSTAPTVADAEPANGHVRQADAGDVRFDADAAPLDHEWLHQSMPLIVALVPCDGSPSARHMLEALALVRSHEEARCLVLGGRGDDRFAELARELGVGDAVACVDGAGSPDQLVGSAFAVVDARVEPVDRVPYELTCAAVHETPMISTRRSEAVDDFLGAGSRGVLIARRDSQAIADAILQLLWDDEARQEFVTRAKKHVCSLPPAHPAAYAGCATPTPGDEGTPSQ